MIEKSVREMVEYLAKALSEHPDSVSIEEEEDTEDGITLKLKLHPEDKGRIIGKNGRVAQSIRSLIRVGSVKSGTKIRLRID